MITLLNVIALVTIMLAMGLRVRFQEVTGSTRPFWLVALALFANYALVPAVTLVLLYIFQAESMVSVGFVILAVCPGAPVGPPITARARGNVPWAIGMMVILAGSSALISPVLLGSLLAWIAPQADLHIDSLVIMRTLLVTQMLPLALGLAIHHWLPAATSRIVKPLQLLGNVFLLALIVAIVATQYHTLAAIRIRGWIGMTLLLLASLAIGWFCAGPDAGIRKALAITTAARNAAVGLIIVNGNFPDTPAVTAVVAYGLITIVGALAFGTLIGRFDRRDLVPSHAA